MKLIKYYRALAGVTQKELAEQVGITQAYLCQLEGGIRANPSAAILLRIAKALEVSPHALMPKHKKRKEKANMIMDYQQDYVKQEDIVGAFEVMDFTDAEDGTYYIGKNVARSRMDRWPVAFEVREDCSVSMHLRDKTGSISTHNTFALPNGPTYVIDDYYIYLDGGFMFLFGDAGALRYYALDPIPS